MVRTNEAKELERRAKQAQKKYDRFLKENYKKDSSGKPFTDYVLRESAEMQLSLADIYESAASKYLKARKFKGAIKNYGKACSYYKAVFSHFVDPGKEKKYKQRYFKTRNTLERLEKIKKRKWHGLEGRTATASVALIGLGAGIFFLSPNLTGHSISNLTQVATNIIGGSLFVIGVIGSYFYLKKR
jgi:hypothetical protein